MTLLLTWPWLNGWAVCHYCRGEMRQEEAVPAAVYLGDGKWQDILRHENTEDCKAALA